MDIFDERKALATQEAQRLIDLLAKGYMLMDGAERIEHMAIDEKYIYQKYNETSFLIWFNFDKTYDDGMWTGLDRIYQMFRRVKVYQEVVSE